MEKKINLNLNIYELYKQYPEIIDILDEVGFHDVKRPMAIFTVGRLINIPKGSALKGIGMPKIVKAFQEHGFTCEFTSTKDVQKEVILQYLKRIENGENIASIQQEFAKEFQSLDSKQIVQIEHELLEDGYPLEWIENLVFFVHPLLDQENQVKRHNPVLLEVEEVGSPLWIFLKENEYLQAHLDRLSSCIEQKQDTLYELLDGLYGIVPHYMKKDELLFPILKDLGYPGPHDVMWGVEDDIRKRLSKVLKATTKQTVYDRLEDIFYILTRIQDMIDKEENILFPLCKTVISLQQWQAIHIDMPRLGFSFLKEVPTWEKAVSLSHVLQGDVEHVELPTGRFSLEQLEACLKVLPVELTFIDEHNIVRYFSDVKEHIFKRPLLCLGRDVMDCHSPLIKPIVKKVIEDLRSGKRKDVTILRPIRGKKILVRYIGVFGRDQQYMGVLEAVEDLTAYIK